MSSTYKTRAEQVRAFLRARPEGAWSATQIAAGTGLGPATVRETIGGLVQAGHVESNGKRPGLYRMLAEPGTPGRKSAATACAAANPPARRDIPMPEATSAGAGSGQIAGLRTHTAPGPLDPAILRPLIRPGAGGPAVPGVRINPSIYDRRRP